MVEDRTGSIPQLQADTLSDKRDLLRRVFSYVRPYRKRLIVGLACTVVASWFHVGGLGLIKPTLEVVFGEREAISSYAEPTPEEESAPGIRGVRRWLEEHLVAPLYRRVLIPLQGRPFMAVLSLGLVLVAMEMLKGVFSYAQAYLTKWVVHRMAADLRVRVYEHLNTLSLDYITSRGTGQLMAHVTSDIELFVTNIDIIGDSLIQPFTILSILTVLFLIHPQMTLIAIIVIPAVGYTLRVMGRRARRASRSRQENVAGLSGILQETFSAARVVRAFCMERYEQERIAKEVLGVFRNSMKIVRARALAPSIMETLGALAVLLVLVGGYFFALRPGPDQLDPSTFMSYIGMVFALYQPIRRLSRVSITFNNALAGAERVFHVLDTPAQVVDRPGAGELPPFSESIEYRNVAFEYQPGIPALSDVSIRIAKGETVALVGPSGAGKSTFVNLLARFYDVTSGAILIDGTDIRDVRLRSLRERIGLVPQEVVLFNDTVRNNIAYGRPDLDLETVRAAARQANADDFIQALPEGYDTMVGERGHALSGGQCQRISIARALVKDPPILIFDEATSSLDSESEIEIRKAMVALMRNRTTIVIAHRLSTVLHADRIVVLDQGCIVGTGPHADLLRDNALYQRLHHLQFGGADVASAAPAAPPK